MEYKVAIVPYLYGKYFGDNMSDWLKENFQEDEYTIIPLTDEQFYSSTASEMKVVFENEYDAVAFKLRWI